MAWPLVCDVSVPDCWGWGWVEGSYKYREKEKRSSGLNDDI